MARAAPDWPQTNVFDLPPGFVQQEITAGLNGATNMAIAPDGRVFICEQTGTLRVVSEGKLLPTPALELEVDSHWERGLLGIALDPNFAGNQWLYVFYVAARPYPHHRLSRFTLAGNVAVPDSEVMLLEGDDQSKLGGKVPAGHQGGGLHFGPDGKLYVAIGEQTAGQPSQRLDTFQGKLLRIDPDGTIPADNPFFNATRGKYRAIWAYGLRNPFGFAFQPATGRMLINDVGGSRWEEINEGSPGANYGWPVSEGPTTRAGHRAPLLAYGEGHKKSLAGGAFHDPGKPQFPAIYTGKYFFAEYMQGWIGVLDPKRPQRVDRFAGGLPGPVALAFAPDGSLYVLVRNAWVNDEKFRTQSGSLVRLFHAGNHEVRAPQVTIQPKAAPLAAGDSLQLKIATSGEPPLEYRWRKNGHWIEGAAFKQLSLTVGDEDDGARVDCVVSNRHGTVKSSPARVSVVPLRKAISPAGALQPGVQVETYQGGFSSLPAFDQKTRVGSTLSREPEFDIDRLNGGAVTYRGWIAVEYDGAYQFQLSSAGAARLLVAGADVAAVGMRNGPHVKRGTVGLRAGLHAFRLDCAAASGMADRIELAWSGPGFADQPLRPDQLFQAATDDLLTHRHGQRNGKPMRGISLATTLNVPLNPLDLPLLLSQTGLFQSLETLEPMPGVVPYEVNSPLWSDGAAKRRWIALPGDATIGFNPTGNWSFPVGTVLVKHFELVDPDHSSALRRLETRLLVVGYDGEGYGVTYRWRNDGSDAELLSDGLQETVAWGSSERSRSQPWSYPSRIDCLVCHTRQAGFVLGVNTRQLNRQADSTGHMLGGDQLQAWMDAGLFDSKSAIANADSLPRLVDPLDESASLEDRVRSYLDANCAQCHRPGGVRSEFDARFETPLAQRKLLDGKLVAADLGDDQARLVFPGNPAQSMLFQRMNRRQDVFNMPPLGSHLVDQRAGAIVAAWIEELAKGPSHASEPFEQPSR